MSNLILKVLQTLLIFRDHSKRSHLQRNGKGIDSWSQKRSDKQSQLNTSSHLIVQD